MNLKLGLKRVSQLPNGNRQFCYHIVSGDTTGVAGIVTTDAGQRMFWSFTRKGELNKSFNENIETRTAVGKNGPGEYINLVDSSLDVVGGAVYQGDTLKKLGVSAGIVDQAIVNKVFNTNEVTKATPSIQQPSTQPTVEQPAAEVQAGATVQTEAEVEA